MASSSYQSTPETTNKSRVSRVILGPCTDGLRDILRHFIPPSSFPSVIEQHVRQNNLLKLTADQRNLVLPQHGSYTGSYSDFDATLLYTLLRNITSGISPHSNGWGNDPDPSDRSLSANIERVRLIRNKCYGHSISASMSNTEFLSTWSAINSAMVDLDTFLNNGKKYENDVDFLLHETMDPERDSQYEEQLRKQVEEDRKTREMVVSLLTIIFMIEARDPQNKNLTEIFTDESISILNDMKNSITEMSSVSDIELLHNVIEEYISNEKENASQLASFPFFKELGQKIERYTYLKNNEMQILARHLRFILKLMKEYSAEVEFSKGSVLLKLTFSSKKGYDLYMHDLQRGKIEKLILSVFHYPQYLENFGLQVEDVTVHLIDNTTEMKSHMMPRKPEVGRKLPAPKEGTGGQKRKTRSDATMEVMLEPDTTDTSSPMQQQDSEIQNTQQQDSEILNTQQQDSEILNTQQQDLEIQNTQQQDSEIQNTQQQDSEIQNTQQQDSEIQNTQQQDSEILNTQQQDSEVQNTQQQDSEIQNTQQQDLEIQNTQQQDSEIQNTQQQDSEILNTQQQVPTGLSQTDTQLPLTSYNTRVASLSTPTSGKFKEETKELHGRFEEETEETKKVQEETKELHGKVTKLTESLIPTNVREIYDIDIQKWREEDKLYYETHSFPSLMEKVRNQPYITIVGVPGSGKSAMAHHIALKLQEEGYEVVPVNKIPDIKHHCDTKNPQVFVIDDVVGVFGLQKTKLAVLTDYEQKITQPCMVKSRTLMTCREAVFNETLPYKPFLTKKETVIRLHSSDHELNDNDKKQILKKYGLNEDLMSPALLKSTSRMFPLLSKLFSKETKFQGLGSKFFLNPVQCIIDELDHMQRYNKLNYATLVLCMLNENNLAKDILKDKKNELFMNMKLDSLESCELESQTDAFKFVKALSAMEGTYTKQSGAQYTFIHDSMFEICAYHYGNQFPDQMLLYMSSSYIANSVKPQTIEPGIAYKVKEKQCDSSKGDKSSNDSDRKKENDDKSNESDAESNENDDKSNERKESFDLCIRLREDQYPLLAERLYRDIQNMELYDVFRNPVLKHSQVCQAFIGVLETKSCTELKALFLSSHGKVDKVVSKRKCVEKESEERRAQHESARQSALVDQREKRDDKGERKRDDKGELIYTYNVRVISWVIYYGHHQIIKYIIQRTTKHNETSELLQITGNSPHQPKSGISTCDKQESENNRLVEQCRLLILSCYSGDVQTVRVLIPVCKKAINGIGQLSRGIDWFSHTPLTAACEEGHVGIVKELVKVGADVNLQGYRDTPLVAACREGHVSVVEELVKAGADVNLHDDIKITPLTAACMRGHVSVMEVLVKAGADANPQVTSDIWDNTPLMAACINGQASVVKELVKAGTDVNLHSKYFGNTPLSTACSYGHVNVVEKLVQVGADVNLQNRWGNTPLITACYKGHVSVVVELVKAGADVNLQSDNRNTSLIAACEGGNVSVVEELVKAGANVNLRDSRGYTPLIAVVKKFSLSTVKYLVEHGAGFVTQVVDFNVSAVYTALIHNKPDIVKYLIQEQNKISPGKFTGNVHLFNCLVEIRHAGVKTDSRDDVVMTDRSVWCMDKYGDLWRFIREGFCDVLRSLLCVGLDVNQSIQLYYKYGVKSDVRPLLYTLIDEKWYVKDISEKVSFLRGAGADVNVRARYREYGSVLDRILYREYYSVLDREGVSVLEWTKRQVRWYNKSEYPKYIVSKYKEVMCEIKKHVRRHSI